MNPIDTLPDWQWSSHAEQEIMITGQELVEQSDFAWRVSDAAVCGLIYNSYCSPPWMWFALRKGVGLRELLDFRRYAEFIPSGALTAVLENFEPGIRFARLYGFRETGEIVSYGDHDYLIFRRD